jgi:hypothetical protein
MSIDFVIRDKIQYFLNKTALITNNQEAEAFQDEYFQEAADFESFTKSNYPKFFGYIEKIKNNKVSEGKHYEILEKLSSEEYELKKNLKLMLELFMSITKFHDETFKEQENWLNELNRLDI